VQVSNFCTRTSQWKSCYVENICLPHALDMDILLVVCGVTGISIVNYFCETLVRELNFKKSLVGPILTVKIRLEVGAFSLTFKFPVFCRSDCVISTLVLRVQFCGLACSLYILMFSCYVFFVVHMSSVCLADVQDFWILLWMLVH